MIALTGLMWNKSKTLLVPVGDPEGKFFCCAEGAEIPDDAPLKVMPPAENKNMGRPARKSATREQGETDG
jgi:hypothetical protein